VSRTHTIYIYIHIVQRHAYLYCVCVCVFPWCFFFLLIGSLSLSLSLTPQRDSCRSLCLWVLVSVCLFARPALWRLAPHVLGGPDIGLGSVSLSLSLVVCTCLFSSLLYSHWSTSGIPHSYSSLPPLDRASFQVSIIRAISSIDLFHNNTFHLELMSPLFDMSCRQRHLKRRQPPPTK
jgi:hypothetical protein